MTDSFGLNPWGPGWAQAELVRKHVRTIALGTQTGAQPGHEADEEVADATALLQLMCAYGYDPLTMAQLSGTGYEEVRYRRASAWQAFNIIVGDATQTNRILELARRFG